MAGGVHAGATITLSGTPAQVDAALATLRYQAAGGAGSSDLLTVTVDDDSGATFTAVLGITITAPSVPPVVQANASELPSAPPPNSSAPDNVSTSAAGSAPGGGVVSRPVATDAVNAPVNLQSPASSVMADDPGTDAAAQGGRPALRDARGSSRDVDGAAPDGMLDQTLLALLTQDADAQDGRAGLSRVGFGTRGLELEIDGSDPAAMGGRDTGEELDFGLGELNLASAATISFTAGFVWWLTRSGGMLTMLLMGIPAWRHVDLLPVLARDLDEEERQAKDVIGEPRAEDTAFEHSAYEVRLDDLFEPRDAAEEKTR
jgi:hypothetical protein